METHEQIRLERQSNPSDLQKLEREITELAAHLYAGTYRWLCLLREFDERDGWAGWGIHSCAHWLNWKCGLGMCAAREKLRVAHALKHLPNVSAAFARGELSYSKARAITRVGNPDNEEYLLQIAQGGTASQLERLVRTYRRVRRDEELERAGRQHEKRCLHYDYDEDGSLVVRARVPAERGAMVIEALRAAVEVQRDECRQRQRETGEDVAEDSAEFVGAASCRDGGVKVLDELNAASRRDAAPTKSCLSGAAFGPDRAVDAGDSAETPDSPGPSTGDPQHEDYDTLQADGLVLMCESFLANGARPLYGGERTLVMLHVDSKVLSTCAGDGRCELSDGPWIAADTARRLACDSSVVELIEGDDGQPLNVGRRTRSIPPAIRRALRSRDDGCRFPGCTRRRYVDGHHVKHWAEGGETSLDNLISLCRYHHCLVHEGGFGVKATHNGKFVFTRPDGIPMMIAPGVPPVDAQHGTSVRRMNDALGLDIDERTCIPEWYGDTMDMDLAVSALYQCDETGSGWGPPAS